MYSKAVANRAINHVTGCVRPCNVSKLKTLPITNKAMCVLCV